MDYDLADLGSRFAAFLADSVLLASALVVTVLGGLAFAGGPGFGSGLGLSAMIIALSVVTWGYFVGFEALWDGRTPGKRLLGLRVLHAGGHPLTWRGAAIRNLVRVADLQPAFTGALGGAVMMATGRTQRLGDLAADTIVVRDDGWGRAPWEQAPPPGGRGRPRLGEEEFALLSRFMARRDGLAPPVRSRLAAKVAAALPEAPADRGLGSRGVSDRLESLHREEAARRGGAADAWGPQAAALARSRRGAWRAYGDLVVRARRRGLARLSENDVRSFGRLYRGMTADLARARTYRAPASLLYGLEKWTGTGHNLLYRAQRGSGPSVARWIGVLLPRAVRSQAAAAGLAALLLFGSGLATYAAVRADPGFGRRIVSADMFARAENTRRGDPEAPYIEVPTNSMSVLASGVATNNVRVVFMTFAGGALAGLGTAAILVVNGIFLGAVFGVYANTGVLAVLLAFVAPHGVLELTAICLGGGAGFALGKAVLLPGRRTRKAALAEQARSSLSTLACAVALLLVAGLVEGYYSPSGLPSAAKFAFSAASAACLALYFGFAGRRGPDAEAPRDGGSPRRALAASAHGRPTRALVP